MSSDSSTVSINGLPSSVRLMAGTMLWGSSVIDKLFTIPDGKITSTQTVDDIVRLAAAAGVAIDTAEGYSNAEQRLGDAMRRNSAPLHVSTKFLPAPWRCIFGAAWAERSFLSAVDASLARLQVKAIDVYYLHTPTAFGADLLTWTGAAHAAFKQKKIKAFGVSNCDAPQLRSVCAAAAKMNPPLPIAANQFQLNLLTYGSPKVRETIEACHELKVTPVCFGVLGQGLLSNETLSAADAARSRMLTITGAHWERDVVPLRQALKAVAVAHGGEKAHVNMAAVCLAWARSKGVVPLVGCRKVEHLREAINAETVLPALSAAEIATLDGLALGRHTFEKSALRRSIFVVVISLGMATYRFFEWLVRPLCV
jgi:aryl-alcohol dehydrogenase-like predicted oxidoreductase